MQSKATKTMQTNKPLLPNIVYVLLVQIYKEMTKCLLDDYCVPLNNAAQLIQSISKSKIADIFFYERNIHVYIERTIAKD